MKKRNNSNGLYPLMLLILMMFSSCTVNDEGEFELTWLFWVILIAFVVLIISSISKNNKEAAERGISVDELLEEKKNAIKQRQMASGFEVEYLGGYPKWTDPCKVTFCINDSNILLKKGSDLMILNKHDIVSISNEKSAHRSVGKTAAGAVVGGLLTGGVGLIVGGALGARRKDTSEVYITYMYNGVELTLNLKAGKNSDKVYSWINSVFA